MVLHSNTYYTVPPALCSDAVTKKGAKVQQPLSCTQTQQKETTGNTRPDLTTLLQSYGHMVGESTIWWLLSRKKSLYDSDPWTITNFIQLDNQGFMRMEVIMTLERIQK